MILTTTRHGRTRRDVRQLAAHLGRGEEARVVLVGGVPLSSSDDALRYMEALRDGSRATVAMHHVTLSPAVDLTAAQRDQMVSAILAAMGAQDHAHVLWEHRKDRAEPSGSPRHWHLVVAHVGPDGRALDDGHSYARLEAAARVLEADWGHAITPSRHAAVVAKRLEADRPDVAAAVRVAQSESPRSATSSARRAVAARAGVDLPKVQAAIRAAWSAADSPAAFRAAIAEKGLEIAPGTKPGVFVVSAGAGAGADDEHSGFRPRGDLKSLLSDGRAERGRAVSRRPSGADRRLHLRQIDPRPGGNGTPCRTRRRTRRLGLGDTNGCGHVWPVRLEPFCNDRSMSARGDSVAPVRLQNTCGSLQTSVRVPIVQGATVGADMGHDEVPVPGGATRLRTILSMLPEHVRVILGAHGGEDGRNHLVALRGGQVHRRRQGHMVHGDCRARAVAQGLHVPKSVVRRRQRNATDQYDTRLLAATKVRRELAHVAPGPPMPGRRQDHAGGCSRRARRARVARSKAARIPASSATSAVPPAFNLRATWFQLLPIRANSPRPSAIAFAKSERRRRGAVGLPPAARTTASRANADGPSPAVSAARSRAARSSAERRNVVVVVVLGLVMGRRGAHLQPPQTPPEARRPECY